MSHVGICLFMCWANDNSKWSMVSLLSGCPTPTMHNLQSAATSQLPANNEGWGTAEPHARLWNSSSASVWARDGAVKWKCVVCTAVAVAAGQEIRLVILTVSESHQLPRGLTSRKEWPAYPERKFAFTSITFTSCACANLTADSALHIKCVFLIFCLCCTGRSVNLSFGQSLCSLPANIWIYSILVQSIPEINWEILVAGIDIFNYLAIYLSPRIYCALFTWITC